MSNDVHLSRARLNKISKAEVTSTRRCVARNNNGILQKDSFSDNTKSDDVNDFLFGSISPRGNHTNIVPLMNELESPEHTHRDTTESDNNISSCSTLDIVNKIENLTLQQLEVKVSELTKNLKDAEKDRLEMQRKLEECSVEKDLCLRRLEVISSAHECRITEMHCVIAELTKKLRTKQDTIIIEEQEPDGSDISFQEGGSVYNSDLNLTNPDIDCHTDGLNNYGQMSFDRADILANDFYPNKYDSTENLKIHEKDINKVQIEALQEEVLQLKAQIAFLQSGLDDSSSHFHHKDTEGNAVEKKEDKGLCHVDNEVECMDGNDTNGSIEHHCKYSMHPEDDQDLNNLNLSYHNETEIPPNQYESYNTIQMELPKKAERVKLNCASRNDRNDIPETDIIMQQLQTVFITDQVKLAEVNDLNRNIIELNKKIEQLELELEQSKIQNKMLVFNLDESKEHCDHLYLLCGKYESNAVALQTALNCSDRAIEAYDVMLALLESKLSLNRDKNEENRKAVESVARHLLDRLESEKNICENSLGPWQDTFNIPEKVSNFPWTSEDNNRLRYHVSKLKGTRASVQNTIVNLESPFSDFYEKSRQALNETDKEKAEARDLAMTVLMNEMLQLREDNLNLRNKIEDMEREKLLSIERNAFVVEDTLQQLQLQFQQSQSENIEAEQAAITEQQLVEALSRESELKSRIQSLMSKNISNDLDRGMRDLQKTNLNLEHQLEQNRRKYQAKIKKLERKIQDLGIDGKNEPSIDRGGAESYMHKSLDNSMSYMNPYPQNMKKVPETTL